MTGEYPFDPPLLSAPILPTMPSYTWPAIPTGCTWPMPYGTDSCTATINLDQWNPNTSNIITSNNVTVKLYWNKPSYGVDGCYTTVGTGTTTGTIYHVQDASWTTNHMGPTWSSTTGAPAYVTISDNQYRRSQIRAAIRRRHQPLITSSKRPVGTAVDVREQRARATLCRLIGTQSYQRFLASGFISVRSPRSGKVYQIFPGHGITKVYQHGKLQERLCVVLNGGFPPTDSLIVRYLMILNDEKDFRARAVSHHVPPHTDTSNGRNAMALAG